VIQGQAIRSEAPSAFGPEELFNAEEARLVFSGDYPAITVPNRNICAIEPLKPILNRD